MSRADCADLADAAPRSSTSLTTSRKLLRPSRGYRRGARVQKPGARARRPAPGRASRRPRHRFPSATAADRAAARRAVARGFGARVWTRSAGRLGPSRGRRGAAPARAMAACGAPRGGCRGRRAFGARLADALGFDLADGVFERQALARDIGLRQRRLDRTQLGDERGARPLVQPPAGFAGVVVEALYGTGDQRMIVGHRVFSLRSALQSFTLKLRTGFA